MKNNILQYLEENAIKYTDKIALEDEQDKVTYGEYMDKAKKVGSFISKEVEGKMSYPIAVLIERNTKSLITFMGVVYSGNFYVPIDATMPSERIELIFDTLKPILIIDARGKEEIWEGAIGYEDILANSSIDEKLLGEIREKAIDIDPLYTVFTSGSTGVPKGVVACHRSVMDLIDSFEEAFNFDHEAVFGNQAPFDYDGSVKDIYNSLKVGGTVKIIPKKYFKTPKLLVDFLCEKKVTILVWAASALRIISDFKAMEDCELPKLSHVMFSGEVMPVKSLNYWISKIPTARYVNLYGPTEITCNCTYYEVDRAFQDDESLPIGKPFRNTRVILKNDKNELITKTGETGEICVIGSCLSLGYWNNAEKTKEAFLVNPLITAYESKMYATGDMGYYNEKGDIMFASRRDFQIKHMGHRIELGEIEVALNSLPCLSISCCLYDKESKKIFCFYQAEKECKKEIVMGLSKKLPKYMWPNVYVHYEELPVSKTGKIDRVKLKQTINQLGE